MNPIFSYEGDLRHGTFVARPNRFTLVVRFGEGEERVYLQNSGGLETVLETGRTVLCRPAANDDRKTDFDAIAVDVDGTWVTVDASLPNTVFDRGVRRGLIPRFAGYRVLDREPALPGGGRADLRLATPTDGTALVEVKSNTHVVDGTSKFPDRPTERGRRHLRQLTDLVSRERTECHVVFVVQRPDARRVVPFREVDPEFADQLVAAADAGVTLSAISTAFSPPDVLLHDPALPVAV